MNKKEVQKYVSEYNDVYSLGASTSLFYLKSRNSIIYSTKGPVKSEDVLYEMGEIARKTRAKVIWIPEGNPDRIIKVCPGVEADEVIATRELFVKPNTVTRQVLSMVTNTNSRG